MSKIVIPEIILKNFSDAERKEFTEKVEGVIENMKDINEIHFPAALSYLRSEFNKNKEFDTQFMACFLEGNCKK